MCDFSYPTRCSVSIRELSVQLKNRTSHRKPSSQPAGLKGADTIEATVKPKNNSLHQGILQMKSGRFLTKQFSSTDEEQSSFSNGTVVREVPDNHTVFLIIHSNKLSMAQHKTNELLAVAVAHRLKQPSEKGSRL